MTARILKRMCHVERHVSDFDHIWVCYSIRGLDHMCQLFSHFNNPVTQAGSFKFRRKTFKFCAPTAVYTKSSCITLPCCLLSARNPEFRQFAVLQYSSQTSSIFYMKTSQTT